MQALVDDLEDRPCRRIIVVGLAPVDRVRRRESHHAGFGIDGAARRLEAVKVPRVLGLAAGLDPILGRLHEVVGRYDRVDQFHCPRALDLDLVALEKELQRVGWRQHAGDARRAAGAWKQPDLDLRQPETRLRILRRDPVVAGERELEAAADRGAVDGGDPRLAAGLDPPIEQRELAAFLEQAGRRLLLAVAGKLPEAAAERLEEREIGASAEGVLARGDHHALHGSVTGKLLHQRRELLDRLERDQVHRAARHVPGDEGDAVAVEIDLEVGVAHQCLRPSLGLRSSTIVMAGLVPATPITWHGRALLSGSPGQARR